MRETGEFDLYLAERGQKLVLHYPELKSSTTGSDGRKTSTVQTQVYRLFRKASEIVVDFNEIQF